MTHWQDPNHSLTPAPTRSVLTALALGLAALMLAPGSAKAADNVPAAAEPAQDRLAPVRALVQQGRWRDAIVTLQQIGDTGNADWHNLMGYSHRKAHLPDLAAAERHYDAALRLDPGHRGALEYSGELYLMLGDLDRAEARLAQLRKACTFGCPELTELRQAIAAYKARAAATAGRP